MAHGAEDTATHDGNGPLLEAAFDTIPVPLLVLDDELRVQAANRAFLRTFEVSQEETSGTQVYDLGNGQWNIAELRGLLEQVLADTGTVEEYRVEHDFEDIGRRTMLLNGCIVRRDGGRNRLLLAISDVTEWENTLYELEAGKEFSEKLIDSVREGLLVLRSDLRVHSANESFYATFAVTPEETVGRPIYELGQGQWDIPALRRLLEEILPEKTAFDDFEVEHDFEHIGSRIMLLNARRLDHHDLILLAIRDVTGARRAERAQQALLDELQHRVKNLFANVKSLMRMTAEGVESVDGFVERFSSRLESLERTQDVLTREGGRGADLRDLVSAEMEAHGAPPDGQVTVEGEPLRLRRRTSQALSLAVHELATNALKYGALAHGGHVHTSWAPSADRQHLVFRWRESGVPGGARELGGGFGSKLIREVVPYMLGGTSELDRTEDGLRCEMVVPLEQERDEPADGPQPADAEPR